MPQKPLQRKAYTSIPHLPGSNLGDGDYKISPGQARILTQEPRDGDMIVVTEKLDGSNVAIAKHDGQVIPLIRSGYRAEASHWKQHHLFADWVLSNYAEWNDRLNEGERLCGEWLARTHSLRYDVERPFYAFDLMRGSERALFAECDERFRDLWVPVLHYGPEALSVDEALERLGRCGQAGCLDEAEGCVWRAEHEGRVDFIAKYVRPSFIPGRLLDDDIWNWTP